MDEMFFLFVAHTLFTHFEKGMLWHEHMYILPRFLSAAFISFKYMLPLTEKNFWKRVSLPPPAKEINGGSCVVQSVRSYKSHHSLSLMYPGWRRQIACPVFTTESIPGLYIFD